MMKLTLKNLIISFIAVIFLNTSVNSSLPDFTTLAEEYSSSVVNVSVERKQKERENQSSQMRQNPPGSPFDFFNDERLGILFLLTGVGTHITKKSENFRLFGGVRFGSQINKNIAFDQLGFDQPFIVKPIAKDGKNSIEGGFNRDLIPYNAVFEDLIRFGKFMMVHFCFDLLLRLSDINKFSIFALINLYIS